MVGFKGLRSVLNTLWIRLLLIITVRKKGHSFFTRISFRKKENLRKKRRNLAFIIMF